MSIATELESNRIEIDGHIESTAVFGENKTPNATMFYWWEASFGFRKAGRRESFKSLYKRFWGYHTGTYNGWWEDAKKHGLLRKQYLFEIISSDLELTKHQRSQVEHHLNVTVTDMRRYNRQNVMVTEAVIIALCAYVCHQDRRKCHPNCKDYDDLFEELKEQLGIKERDYVKIYGKLEQDLLRANSTYEPEGGEYVPPSEAGHKWPCEGGI